MANLTPFTAPRNEQPSPLPPQAVIIAGPNGSGKSTAALQLLPAGMKFINADMIAAEVSGVPGTYADINAGRILLDRLDHLEDRREDFAFETTLATKMLVDRVARWREAGYQVHLLFFFLPSADLAVQRVAGRVLAGGHHVPELTVRRRFVSGLRNFFSLYRPMVNSWRMYDNSSGSGPAVIAKLSRDGTMHIENPERWNQLCQEYQD